MAARFLSGQTPDTAEAICTAEDILKIREAVAGITVKESVLGYMEDIVTQTRKEERLLLGASPRALLMLLRASQGKAFLEGRDYVKPDDVKAVVMQVLLHRLVLSAEARTGKTEAEEILKGILHKLKVPIE